MAIINVKGTAIGFTIKKKLNRDMTIYPSKPFKGGGFAVTLLPGVYQMRKRPYVGTNAKSPRSSHNLCVRMKFYEPSDQTQFNKVARQIIFAMAVFAWQRLTDEQKEVYNIRAKRKHFSGYNLFIKEFKIDLKMIFSPDGGLMIKLVNKTGSNTVKGNCVRTSSSYQNSVQLTPQNVPDCVGVFYESGVADGALAWVVVSGIADVYFIGNTTRGHVARTFVSADGDYVLGNAKSEAVPGSPFAVDKHFCEIGHVLESRTGAGLAKCVLHFN